MLPTQPEPLYRALASSALLESAADALVESYVAWREASAEVRQAYRRWLEWRSHDREVAFAGYLAALQQEEHASRVYEGHVSTVIRTLQAAA